MTKILLPIIKSIIADTDTPISIFSKLKSSGAQFLLESAERGEQFGRYSIIALTPSGEMSITNGVLKASGELEPLVSSGNPYTAAKQALAGYTIQGLNQEFPFAGGLAGYFSYDCIRYIESLKNTPLDDLNFPDMHVYLFRQVLVYDHLKHQLSYLRLIDENDASKETLVKIEKEMTDLLDSLSTTLMPKSKDSAVSSYKTYSNINRETYISNVKKAKAYIKEGDIFQVVLSRRKTYTPAPDSFEIYRKLRSVNPSPYMYYLDFENYKIVGSSPECLTRLVDGVVETFPIAGTRKRGETPEQDAELAKDLLNDKKELAEHAMLVDLGRNDIGAISQFGSVHVKDYMHVEYFSHVMHIVSSVQGNIMPHIDGVDALEHCLPAGTVSGAPKIRAMEIIDELENTKRGPYAGAVGYFDFRGNMDMCITIRTLLFKDNCVYAQAGAGIVYDSVPEKEFDETESKLGALVKALNPDDIDVKEIEKP